jgi:hypothetical protein
VPLGGWLTVQQVNQFTCEFDSIIEHIEQHLLQSLGIAAELAWHTRSNVVGHLFERFI